MKREMKEMKESKLEQTLRKLDRGEEVEVSGKKKFLSLRINWHLVARLKEWKKW